MTDHLTDHFFCGFKISKKLPTNIEFSTTNKKFDTKNTLFYQHTIHEFKDLADHILCDWSPIVWIGGIRKEQYFKSCQLLALDFDNAPGDPQLSLEAAKDFFGSKGIAHIIAPSRSHLKPKNGHVAERYRIVIPLEEPITNLGCYRKSYQILLNGLEDLGLFPDRACGDGARFFFASTRVSCCIGLNACLRKHSSETTYEHKKIIEETAASDNIDVPVGKRNSTLFKEAAQAKDWGVPMKNFMCSVRKKYAGLDDNEFENTVRSGYNRPIRQNHNKIDSMDYEKTIADFLVKNKIEYFRDTLTDMVFYRGVEIDDFNFVAGDVYVELVNAGFKIPHKLVGFCMARHLEKSNKNVLLDWINSKPHNGIDYITDFFNAVKTSGDPENRETYLTFFKRWMIGVVARLHDSRNANSILILLGKQGVGKTRWVQLLGHNMPCGFHTGIIDLGNKDHRINASRNAIWFADEYDSITRKSDVAGIKELSTTSSIKERVPYASKDKQRPCGISFIGSTNKDCFLTDTTGNRRYRVIPVEKIELNNSIDKKYVQQMFAQAKCLFDNGEQYWYDSFENEHIDETINADLMIDSEAEHVANYVELGNDHMSLIEMVSLVCPNVGNMQKTLNDLSSILKKKGYVRTKIRGKRGYRVNKITLMRHTLGG